MYVNFNQFIDSKGAPKIKQSKQNSNNSSLENIQLMEEGENAEFQNQLQYQQ